MQLGVEVLPKGLIFLKYEDELPNSLTTLIFGKNYIRKLESSILPQKLSKMIFNGHYPHNLPSLENLKYIKEKSYTER